MQRFSKCAPVEFYMVQKEILKPDYGGDWNNYVNKNEHKLNIILIEYIILVENISIISKIVYVHIIILLLLLLR